MRSYRVAPAVVSTEPLDEVTSCDAGLAQESGEGYMILIAEFHFDEFGNSIVALSKLS